MAIKEHPGWKEFPLETGQAVRADQINALWWALSERSAAVGLDPIEVTFGIFSGGVFIRYEGDDRARLVKGAGQSKLLALNHLEFLKNSLVAAITKYANPNKVNADDSLPINVNWTVSDILKDLKIGGAGGGSSGGGSTADPDLEFTIIPDRPGEVIGKDVNGDDVLFNDFFGPATFGRNVPSDTPTFKEHLNEIYLIIKRLTHLPLIDTPAFITIDNVVGDSFTTDKFITPAQDDAYKDAWEADRDQLTSEIGAGFQSNKTGLPAISFPGLALRATHSRFTSPDELQGKFDYAVTARILQAEIPTPIFPGATAENNDLPNPYVYGEVKVVLNLFEGFNDLLSSAGEAFDAEEPSFAEGILRVLKTIDRRIDEEINTINQGDFVLEFPIQTRFTTLATSGNPITKKADMSNVLSILPIAEFSGDPKAPTVEELDEALHMDFNLYAGEEFGGEFFNVGPPENLGSSQTFIDARRFVGFGIIRGFFEIINWTHVDRERDPLPPNFPSGLESV